MDRLKSFSLKTSLALVIVLPCVGVSTVNAEVGPLEWTSPTTNSLYSVDIVGARAREFLPKSTLNSSLLT